MAKNKDDLVKEAEDLGVPEPESLTKDELEEAIDSKVVPELGPVVPPGEVWTPSGPRPQADDTPEAGR